MRSVILFLLLVLASNSPACCQEKTPERKQVVLDGKQLELKFSDDFESGFERWTTTDPKNWKLNTEGKSGQSFGLIERFSKYKPAVRSPHNLALIKDLKLDDFVFTFDVRNPKDTGNHRDCCVFFGYQNPKQFYYAHLGKKPDQASGQIMIVNEKPRAPLTENKDQIRWTDNWHKIKVTRNSDNGEIKIYFDNMTSPCMQIKDKTFGKGQFGIGSFDDINHFDNVRVYGN